MYFLQKKNKNKNKTNNKLKAHCNKIITYIEITSWLVSAYDFYSQQVNKDRTSEPTMRLFVYFISTEISFNK